MYIDGHCDTLSKALDEEKDLYENDLQISLKKIEDIGGGIQIMACFIDPKFVKENNGGFNRCCNIIKKINEYELKNKTNIIIKDNSQFIKCVKNNNTGVILSVENGSAISGNLDNIEYFYQQGIRIMSITWNDDNDLGCGAKTTNDVRINKFRKRVYKNA